MLENFNTTRDGRCTATEIEGTFYALINLSRTIFAGTRIYLVEKGNLKYCATFTRMWKKDMCTENQENIYPRRGIFQNARGHKCRRGRK